jgi:predicted GIY-YIG superfamily endonuclease
MSVYVYIVRCSDGSYYVGSARGSLELRIAQHNAGSYGGYTAKRRPVTLVWHQECQWATDAIAAERQIKGWSRAKKEALIRGDYDLIQILAKRRQPFGTASMTSMGASRSSFETRPAGAPQDEDEC